MSGQGFEDSLWTTHPNHELQNLSHNTIIWDVTQIRDKQQFIPEKYVIKSESESY